MNDHENGFKNGIEDPRLRQRLRAAMATETTPSHLLERVRDLALRLPPEPAVRERGPLVEMLPPLCGVGLLLALLAGGVRRLPVGSLHLPEGYAVLLAGLFLPLLALALVELLRGAPTLRAWWR